MSAQDIQLGKGPDATTLFTFDWATLVHTVFLALKSATELDLEDARLLRQTIQGMTSSKNFPIEFYPALIASIPEDNNIWSIFKVVLQERQAIAEHGRFTYSLEEKTA